MSLTNDKYKFSARITKITDLNRLREIISGVIGEVCWRANFSYGDELNIHIGAKIPYSEKSLTGKQKGAWILGTRATLWTLDYPKLPGEGKQGKQGERSNQQ